MARIKVKRESAIMGVGLKEITNTSLYPNNSMNLKEEVDNFMRATSIAIEEFILKAGYKSLHDFSRKNSKLLSNATVNRMIHNKYGIKLKTIFTICTILELDLFQFLHRVAQISKDLK